MTLVLLVSSAFVVFVVTLGWLYVRLSRRSYNRSESSDQLRDADHDLVQANLINFVGAPIHYQMREAVDHWSYLRSESFTDLLKSTIGKLDPEYHAVIFYQLRWLRDGYPGPPPEVCNLNREAGKSQIFPSIGAGLGADMDTGLHALWAAEAEGAFLRAETIDEMRNVAMHYPILLRPLVQGGIDFSIIKFLEPNRTAYFVKLRHLQRLREEIEGHSVESWWRPIDRQYGSSLARGWAVNNYAHANSNDEEEHK